MSTLSPVELSKIIIVLVPVKILIDEITPDLLGKIVSFITKILFYDPYILIMSIFIKLVEEPFFKSNDWPIPVNWNSSLPLCLSNSSKLKFTVIITSRSFPPLIFSIPEKESVPIALPLVVPAVKFISMSMSPPVIDE